jgi:hypothetical protein
MFVDQLRVAISAEQHGEIVEPGDDALQLHAIDQEHRYRRLALANVIEKHILYILRFFVGHGGFLIFVAPPGAKSGYSFGVKDQVCGSGVARLAWGYKYMHLCAAATCWLL